jgi:hypothetical protein
MILSLTGNILQVRLFKSNLGTFFAIDKGRKFRPTSKLNLFNGHFVYVSYKSDMNITYHLDKVRGLVYCKARPLYQHHGLWMEGGKQCMHVTLQHT